MKLFNNLKPSDFTNQKSSQDILLNILTPLIPFYSEGCARLRIGDTRTHYELSSQEMEAFARPLWGLTALVTGLSKTEKETVFNIISDLRNSGCTATAFCDETFADSADSNHLSDLVDKTATLRCSDTSHVLSLNSASMSDSSSVSSLNATSLSEASSSLKLIAKLVYIYQRGIISGTDPASPEYWGLCHDFDQKFCEMPALGFAMLYAPEFFLDPLTETEKSNLADWLGECNRHDLCACNWQFFQIITNLALKVRGLPYSQENMDSGLDMIDDYYSDGGWYNDGNGGDKDYYNPFVMLSFGLIYRDFMSQEDPERCARFYDRAMTFGKDFKLFFDDTGACFPYGRSMTYRFAQSAFWATCLMTQVYPISIAEMREQISHNLCWWLSRPIFDNSGVLTIGYGYGNLQMSESYNAPGSPYWALQGFFHLALPETDEFWLNDCAKDEAIKDELIKDETIKDTTTVALTSSTKACANFTSSDQADKESYSTSPHFTATYLPAVPMLLQRANNGGCCDQVVALVPGKTNHEGHSHNIEKYSKFAYSSKFGFSISRSSAVLQENAPDSTLAFEIDGYIYVKNMTEPDYVIDKDHILMHWSPVRGIQVTTTLYPTETGHIRDHIITVDNTLYKNVSIKAYDCGFAVPNIKPATTEISNKRTFYTKKNEDLSSYYSCIARSLMGDGHNDILTPDPNTNLLYPKTKIPMSIYEINNGTNHIKTEFIYL